MDTKIVFNPVSAQSVDVNAESTPPDIPTTSVFIPDCLE